MLEAAIGQTNRQLFNLTHCLQFISRHPSASSIPNNSSQSLDIQCAGTASIDNDMLLQMGLFNCALTQHCYLCEVATIYHLNTSGISWDSLVQQLENLEIVSPELLEIKQLTWWTEIHTGWGLLWLGSLGQRKQPKAAQLIATASSTKDQADISLESLFEFETNIRELIERQRQLSQEH